VRLVRWWTSARPAGHATGIFQVIAKADGPNVIVEGSEANNTRLRSVQIR
jgi:hypothetical protein